MVSRAANHKERAVGTTIVIFKKHGSGYHSRDGREGRAVGSDEGVEEKE